MAPGFTIEVLTGGGWAALNATPVSKAAVQRKLDTLQVLAKYSEVRVRRGRSGGVVDHWRQQTGNPGGPATKRGPRVVYHVVKRARGWAVVRNQAMRAVGIYATQGAAVARARDLAWGQWLGQYIVHGRDGKIRYERTYGADPARTRG